MNNYEKQALVWDWDAFDDMPEYKYWLGYASRFGKNVLLPMCAHGKAGAYLAENGLYVTAFDITPNMIAEGKKRFGHIPGLQLITADILDLSLPRADFDFAYIAGNGDLHLLSSIADVESAFLQLHRHLRPGGCLALELTMPFVDSWSSPRQIFHPRVPGYTDKKIYKANESSYDTAKQRHCIRQEVFVEDTSGTKSFVQEICLQYYTRDVITETLVKCGFDISGEWSSRQNEPWKPGDPTLIIEALKLIPA